MAPPDVPLKFAFERQRICVERPGRPPELRSVPHRVRNLTAAALRDPKKRAMLLHLFWHHELQAAELMCWALLSFPDTPPSFRRGLVRIALDEMRHMQMYAEHIRSLGFKIGDFAINDWFWQRVPASESPAMFVSAMGVGFEAGNLDHGLRFASRFEEAGDLQAGRIQRTVVEEEIPHVAFGVHWLKRFAGVASFDVWRAHLVPPLSPMVMRGHPMAIEERTRAGQDEEFLARLSMWSAMWSE